MNTYIGIEIGGTKLQLAAGNELGDIYKRIRYNINRNAGAEGIRKQLVEGLQALQQYAVTCIGVGFGGPVDRHKNTIFTSHQVEGWAGFALTEWLGKISGIPVFIDNDANLAALAEGVNGAGKNYDTVFYVTLGSGVGGGFIINKNIYYSTPPGEAEFGHLRLDKTGRTVESSCSGWAVNKKIKVAAEEFPKGRLAILAGEAPCAEAKILLKAIEEKDEQALRIFEETADDLAFGLSLAVQLIHPDIIILGGGLSLMGELLQKEISNRITGYIMDAFKPGPVVKLAALKEDAVTTGALLLAHKKFSRK